MPITLKCRGCGKTLKVRDEFAGKKGKCPACARVIEIPARDDTIRDEPPGQTVGPPFAESKGWRPRLVIKLAAIIGGLFVLIAAFLFSAQVLRKSRITPLVSQLESSDRQARLGALLKLASMGRDARDKDAVKAIQRMADSKEDLELAHVAAAVRYMVDPRYEVGEDNVMAYLAGRFKEDTLLGLMFVAKTEDAEASGAAVRAIGWRITVGMSTLSQAKGMHFIVDFPELHQAVTLCCSFLHDERVVMRRSAAMALLTVGMHREEVGIPALALAQQDLRIAAQDEDKLVRGLAKMALGQGGQTDEDTKAAASEWRSEWLRFYDY